MLLTLSRVRVRTGKREKRNSPAQDPGQPQALPNLEEWRLWQKISEGTTAQFPSVLCRSNAMRCERVQTGRTVVFATDTDAVVVVVTILLLLLLMAHMRFRI
jgi:ribonuclease BN (tRNA processing enzyme)